MNAKIFLVSGSTCLNSSIFSLVISGIKEYSEALERFGAIEYVKIDCLISELLNPLTEIKNPARIFVFSSKTGLYSIDPFCANFSCGERSIM